MKTEPNRNEAPEGATHWGPENDDYHSGWYKESLGKWFAWDGERKEWGRPLFGFIGGDRHESLVKIPTVNQQLTDPVVKESLTTEKVVCSEMEPTTWNGQGLPPVGIECEYKHNIQEPDNPNAWQKCFIIGFTKDCKWMCFHSYASDYVEMHAVNSGVYVFRPLKTERERWIETALGLRKPGAYTDEQWLSDIYDSGLAKLPD